MRKLRTIFSFSCRNEKLQFYDRWKNVLRTKNDSRTYDSIRKNAIAQAHDYTTGYLPDYLYFEKYYKIIAIYLRKQQKLDADPNTIKQKHFSRYPEKGRSG